MRKYCLLVSLILVIFIPSVLFALSVPLKPDTGNFEIPSAEIDTPVIKISDGEKIYEMNLEKYVASVLFGEMPMSFEMEALKAQAVAIRTYTLKHINTDAKHIQFNLCTDPACCQAFRELDNTQAARKAAEATQATTAEVLMYEEELIDATYFSCSGGMTEAAVEVWGADVPYLQATKSPGEEGAVHYQDTIAFTRQEFFDRLGIPIASDVAKVTYTEGGGIKILSIGDACFSGQELRQLLGLRSTSAEIIFHEEYVEITTKGYGHRVGMSQYGANAMAINGNTYDQILEHYYLGTKLRKLDKAQLNGIFDKDQIL